MCLAVPGRVIEVTGEDPVFRHGIVDFGGVRRQVSFSFTPQVELGQYVLVHVGFALQVVDEEEAQRIFEDLKRMDELAEAESG